MPSQFTLPEISEGVTEVEVGEFHVKAGDTVSNGDPLFFVQTEKSGIDVEADFDGVVTDIHIAEGDMIPIGHHCLSFSTDGEAPSGDSDSSSKPEAAETKDEGAKSSAEDVTESNQGGMRTDANSYPESPDKRTASPDQTTHPRPDLSKEIPPPAAPNVRRAARERGIDLRTISGSGAGGRITMSDLGGGTSTAVAPAGGVRGGQGVVSAPTLPEFSNLGPVKRERMQMLAKTAARNLSLSWQVVPHVTQHDLVDITDLEAARKRFVKGVGQNKPKVTMTALMAKAVVTVLKEFPKFNASFDHETNEIVYKEFYNIGIAVDTPNGLVVPVIFDVDQKSILSIADDVTDLAVRARDRKLTPQDQQGGTFTITNLGGIGGTNFTPIVNYPEVAILGMSRSQKQLALEDGQIVERLMLPLSMSYDHRVINGADAARFIVRLSGLLSDPMQLLVEA